MNKLLIIVSLLSMSVASYAGSKQGLACNSKGITLKAQLSGYNLTNIDLKIETNQWNISYVLTSTQSYDMFNSQKFSPEMPYPTYSFSNKNAQEYILALPGGDMRNYQFTALLFVNDTYQKEIELNCITRSL